MSLEESPKLYCPQCKHRLSFGPLFDHHYKSCKHCKTNIAELFLPVGVILVAVDLAPNIVKTLLEYLQSLPELEAYEELMKVLSIFGIEE